MNRIRLFTVLGASHSPSACSEGRVFVPRSPGHHRRLGGIREWRGADFLSAGGRSIDQRSRDRPIRPPDPGINRPDCSSPTLRVELPGEPISILHDPYSIVENPPPSAPGILLCLPAIRKLQRKLSYVIAGIVFSVASPYIREKFVAHHIGR
jgi:hypothetical protein